MHENEANAAKEIMMPGAEETQSFLLGDVDESKISTMKDKGIIVQVLEEDPPIETLGMGSEMLRKMNIRSIQPELHFAEAAEEQPIVDYEKPNFYLIQLKGPILESWRQELKNQQVKLLEYIPVNSYTAKLDPSQFSAVSGLHFVRSVRLYGQQDTGPVTFTAAASGEMRSISPLVPNFEIITYDILLHRNEDLQIVIDWLRQNNVNIGSSSGRKIRVFLLSDSGLINAISRLPEVAYLEEFVRPKLHNDVARLLMGLDAINGSILVTNLSQSGEDQIVAVADTGIDDTHPDFNQRIAGIVSLGRPNDYSDTNGHGTHVAGSVLGDGSESNGQIRGVAPRAKLFFQSLMDRNGELGGIPHDLKDLFQEAYDNGARIHNNSWGATAFSMYRMNSLEVDEFIDTHPDMLIVISAGNEGQASARLNAQKGFVDWLSLGSPASSKNALTVGASRSNRTSGGYSTFTYNQQWPADFPDGPIADERISGNPECLAAFSSRGPCDDRRIKPDLVAPGTDILSTKSSRAPLRNFWGSHSNNRYAYMGGTSMSAPLVSGCATLIREYYVKDRNHEPSSALLKATLINSTRWLTGSDSVADHSFVPNYHQGFGCIFMPWAIPNASMPNLRLEFVDTWKSSQERFSMTGQRYRYKFSVSGGNWIRICLCWIDPPGRALQNNLNLFVQNLTTGKKWVGNETLPQSLNIPDPDNNAETVRIDNPSAGDYLIQVQAMNLLRPSQDFSLVVSGELSSPLDPF